jgi:hypothetical protein
MSIAAPVPPSPAATINAWTQYKAHLQLLLEGEKDAATVKALQAALANAKTVIAQKSKK